MSWGDEVNDDGGEEMSEAKETEIASNERAQDYSFYVVR
jgi:hypothetical protein